MKYVFVSKAYDECNDRTAVSLRQRDGIVLDIIETEPKHPAERPAIPSRNIVNEQLGPIGGGHREITHALPLSSPHFAANGGISHIFYRWFPVYPNSRALPGIPDLKEYFRINKSRVPENLIAGRYPERNWLVVSQANFHIVQTNIAADLSFAKASLFINTSFSCLEPFCSDIGGINRSPGRLAREPESPKDNERPYYRNPDLSPSGRHRPESPLGGLLLCVEIAALVAIGVAFAWVAAEIGDFRSDDARWRFRLLRWSAVAVGLAGCGTFYGWAMFGGPLEFWRLPLAWANELLGYL
jgi:hypothetical protein